MRKFIVAAAAAALGVPVLAACSSDADVASHNLSKEADEFHVFRQIVVYNAITDKYILEVEGYCSLGNHDPSDEVSYTCKSKDSNTGLTKDIIKKSDNTFVFVHQLEPKNVSTDYFKVIFKPSTIIPDVDLQ